MLFKHTILPVGSVPIDYNFGSVKPFPSANHSSALKLKHQRLVSKITEVRRTNDAG